MQDSTVFDDMVARLRATNKFRFVVWGQYDQPLPQEGAIAHIKRLGFNTDERTSSSNQEERQVPFQVELSVYDSDYERRKGRILDCEGIIINTFHHQRLGGLTLPYRTACIRAKDDLTQPVGVSKTTIIGMFVYQVARVNPLSVGI
jgi:hypothetical protein